jgi:hypothetical protein
MSAVAQLYNEKSAGSKRFHFSRNALASTITYEEREWSACDKASASPKPASASRLCRQFVT